MDHNELIPSIAARIASIDTARLAASLDEHGYATSPALLSAGECRALAALYDDEAAFRSRVVMQRHGFGRGEYKYLRYPLPAPVEGLRGALYPLLAPIANRWREALGEKGRFPASLGDFLAECHAAGQTRPTPLILKYAAGDYNRLHQDLYGALVFPLQLTILLSDPADFAGGEFLLVEQRPRMQSRGRSCHYGKVRRLSSPSITAPCAERAASTASICGTASAGCAQASAPLSVSSSTTPHKRLRPAAAIPLGC